eukprot:g32565.t1
MKLHRKSAPKCDPILLPNGSLSHLCVDVVVYLGSLYCGSSAHVLGDLMYPTDLLPLRFCMVMALTFDLVCVLVTLNSSLHLFVLAQTSLVSLSLLIYCYSRFITALLRFNHQCVQMPSLFLFPALSAFSLFGVLYNWPPKSALRTQWGWLRALHLVWMLACQVWAVAQLRIRLEKLVRLSGPLGDNGSSGDRERLTADELAVLAQQSTRPANPPDDPCAICLESFSSNASDSGSVSSLSGSDFENKQLGLDSKQQQQQQQQQPADNIGQQATGGLQNTQQQQHQKTDNKQQQQQEQPADVTVRPAAGQPGTPPARNRQLGPGHDRALCRLPVCGHVFHLGCISEWLSRNNSCAICRRKLNLTTTATN